MLSKPLSQYTGKGKDKDKGLDTYMSQTRDQQRFKSGKWQLIGMSH